MISKKYILEDSTTLQLQDPSFLDYQCRRIDHWNQTAELMKNSRSMGGYYHCQLKKGYRFYIPPGHSVLEIGCGNGDLLASLNPSQGVGIDFSIKMLEEARAKYTQLQFIFADAHNPTLEGMTFDFIILSDLINDVWDVQVILQNLTSLSHPGTRILLNVYSRLWELPLSVAKSLGIARPVLNQNWLTLDDIKNLLSLGGFEVIHTWQEILLPLQIPLLSSLFNRFLVKVPPFNHLALTNFVLARPDNQSSPLFTNPSVTIVVPARNEAGNIERILCSLPRFDCEFEVIFVEGHSQDNTYETIEKAMANHPEIPCQLFRQPGIGKGDAVRLGFEKARGDILIILDADLTVPAGYLSRFYEAIRSGKGEFINGVRLVYPMQKQAMRFYNLFGNKFFSLAFSYLLGQPVKDTLCGTKVLWRKDYQRIAQNRSNFGDFDPFGDFDLLFGAAKLGLKIVDMPIRYCERTYGSTNIQRWRDGMLLLRMALFAAQKIKFY